MKVTLVHRGARDGFQVARALQNAGLLDTVVTDLYWPADRSWAQGIERLTPHRLTSTLRHRYAEGLSSASVAQMWGAGLSSLAISRAGWLPYSYESFAVRWCDRVLGRRAGRIATRKRTALLSYSYYAHSAFSNYQGDQARILFQLHPHPLSVRAILEHERLLHPDCASSLEKEWELALPERDFRRLVDEVKCADYWLTASQFTKQTLVDAGAPPERIAVIPYGIDRPRFVTRSAPVAKDRPLQLLFVGTLGQRKGIKYLLQAIDLLPKGSVELTACGRPVDDLAIFQHSRARVSLRPSVSASGLLEAYRAADVFVFPSLAEGFAHVLLEAMAHGLPIISTTRTAAPELIRHGKEGFLIEPGNPVQLASYIEMFLKRPESIRLMGEAAFRRVEHFTWARFRDNVSNLVGNILNGAGENLLEMQCSRP
jgi:glycosyltransferase involved in cell wall biosynthesis